MQIGMEQFVRTLTESGLVSVQEAEHACAQLREAGSTESPESLLRELVNRRKLTEFQASQVRAGKAKALTLGNYLILDKLGEGGMGMVLKAWHRRMERTVALKVIAPKVVKDPVALKRFQREVVAAAKLTHPNIVAAYDADEAKGTHFLVMEYVEGSDLSSWVKEHGPLPVEQAVNCVIQTARGLAYAHDKGVVHRDIKPANLLLSRETRAESREGTAASDSRLTVKILDMGLARIEGGFGGSAEHADLTRSGAMMGTVDYMAPEQAMDSKHADARSDIYSLGCTLFYLVTGHVAFEADTVMKRLTAHQSAPPPSLVEQLRAESRESRAGQSAAPLDSGLSTLDSVFRRMVAKKPDDRPQSMLEVIAELERCLVSGSATISSHSGSNPLANASSGRSQSALQRQASGESSTSTSRTNPVRSTGTSARPSERDVETIVSGSIASRTGASDEATVILDSSTPTSRAGSAPSDKSRKAMWISGATAVVVLLAIVVAMSGKSPKPSDDKVVANPPNPDAQSPQPPTNSDGNVLAKPSVAPVDTALMFDGDGLVNVPTLELDPQGSFTWEVLVTAPQESPLGRDGVVIGVAGKGETLAEVQGRSSPAQFLALTRESKWRWKYGVGKDREGNLHSTRTARAERTHLACVCEGQNHRFYMDGKLGKNSEWDAPRRADGNFEFGPRFVGIIDEIRISKVARYKENFTPITRYEPDADTLALYHFDEGSGDLLKDSSGNNHHGQITGAKWVLADGSAIDLKSEI
jgi:serine/threonine protein kinase